MNDSVEVLKDNLAYIVAMGVVIITLIYVILKERPGTKKQASGANPPAGRQAQRGTNAPALSMKSRYQEWRKKWLVENEFVIIGVFFIIHFIWWNVFPEWWKTNILENWRAWRIQGAMLFLLFAIPVGKGILHHKVARVVVWVSIAALIAVIFWPNLGTGVDKKLVVSLPPTGLETSVEGEIPPDANPEILAFAQKEICPEHPDLCTYAAAESHFNQWETVDGKPDKTKPRYAKLNDGGFGTAVGVLQIKSDLHSGFCKGLDIINTYQDNFRCGVKILESPEKGRGPEAWWPEQGGKRVIHINLTAEHPLIIIHRPTLKHFSFQFDADAKLVAGGVTYKVGPTIGEFIIPSPVRDFEFCFTGKPASAVLLYEYWPRPKG